jgi:hypothetical protein
VNGFIDGLKNLFKENYVDIPEDKLDVIEEQEAQIEGLTETSTKLEEEKAALQKELVELKSALAMEEVTTSLTDVQRDKFKELVESVEFTNSKEYVEKLTTLRENYFPSGKPANVSTEKKDETKVVDSSMNSYVDVIGKTIKFN